MFKFIHAADIHLDSPLIGLQQYPGAPVEEIRGATRQALSNLVDLAVAEEVAFILIAGDLYDGDWRDYNTGLYFAAQMIRLQEASIRVFLIAGNHDAANQMTKRLRLPGNVHMFSARRPETVELADLGVAVHGQSFPTRAVTDDLAASYPPPCPDLLNIGLLHTCADGRPGHDAYAPCSLRGLVSRGYGYWALGHVHQREVLSQDPWVVFPGNIQGRYVRETGPKGCTLVTVEEGRVVSAEHQDLDVLRWSLCDVDVSGVGSMDVVLERAASALEAELEGCGGRPLAVRLRLSGACRAHTELASDAERWRNEIRAHAAEVHSRQVWLEDIVFRTSTEADLEAMLARDDALGSLLRGLDGWEADGDVVAQVRSELGDLARRLPAELGSVEGTIGLESPEALREVVDDVKQLVVARLLGAGGGR